MTSPIAPHRTDPWIPTPDASSSNGPATKVPLAARELPGFPDTNAAAIANAVQAATAKPMLGMGVDASVLDTPKGATPIEQRVDAFMESATPTYHVPGEGDVKVSTPFRMAAGPGTPPDSPFGRVEAQVNTNRADLAAVAARAGLKGADITSLVVGRATPEQVHRVTQALIDAGRLPPAGGLLADRVRTMMCNYGIGLDCAGYAQQAFLASRGIARSQTQLRTPTNEDLSNLAGRGFTRASSDDARAGDLVVLKPPVGSPPPGHTAIVREARDATPDEVKALMGKDGPATGFDPARVKKIVVDASWGNGGEPLEGGVERRTWWHAWTLDASTGKDGEKWLSEFHGEVLVGASPYVNHPIEGFYRPATEH